MSIRELECLECGTDTLDNHVVGCNTGTGRYQIIDNGAIVEHAFVESDLYRLLVEIREDKGTLTGVKVYDNGKKLTRAQLGEVAIRAMNGGK
jgi:hypothetical protein